MIRPSVFANPHFLKVVSYAPTEPGREKPCLPGLHFKVMALMSLRKIFLSCKTDKSLGNDLHLKEVKRMCKFRVFFFQIQVFLKVNVLRTWRSGVCSHEEMSQVSGTEGTLSLP